MTDELLKDVLNRVADRAGPVDGLAERALRRAARRRRARILAGAAAVGTAAAVAVPLLLLPGDGGGLRPVPPLASPGTPTVSPDDQGLVNVCMRNGPPTGDMGGPDLLTEKGTPSDYRLLVGTRAGSERVAVVGSSHGFVLCAVQSEANTEPPLLRPWPGDPSLGLWSFPGEVRVDAVHSLTRVGQDGRGSSHNGLHHVIAGRAKSGVARIEVRWNRGRRVEAALQDGYFLARVDSRLVESTGPEKPGAEEERRPMDERVLSVTAFDTDGKVLQVWKAPGKGLRTFDSTRCPYPDAPALCRD